MEEKTRGVSGVSSNTVVNICHVTNRVTSWAWGEPMCVCVCVCINTCLSQTYSLSFLSLSLSLSFFGVSDFHLFNLQVCAGHGCVRCAWCGYV